MAVGEVNVRLNLNKDGYSPAMTKARQEAQALGRTLKEVSHGTVSQMQAASAAIRVVEGNLTNNIRAAERFISTIPGVGAALKAAFPVVGALAFAGVISEIVRRVVEFNHTLEQTRNVANESFTALAEGAQKNADTLRVTNDKLEQQIATLEHKPVNNLALSLDEARLRADELATSLNRDFDAFKKIIEETQKGALSKLFNRGIDDQLGSGMDDRLANVRTLARQQRDQLKSGNQAAADDLGAKLRAAQDEALRFADSQIATRTGIANQGTVREAPYAKVYGNQGLNLDAINQFKDLVSGQEDTADEQKRNTADQARVRALTESNKAQAELLKQFEEQLAKQKAQYGVSVADELAFWSQRINAFTRGSEEFHTVQTDQYRLQSELYQKLVEGKRKFLEDSRSQVQGNDLLSAGAAAFSKFNEEQAERASKSSEQYNEITARGNEIQQKSATAFAETTIQIALQQGAISKLDAAQALAAIHSQDHAAGLERVNRALATQIDLINSDPKLSNEDKTNAVRNAQAAAANQASSINGAYARVQAQDQANISGNTIPGAVKDSLNTMVQSFTDMATNLKQVIPQIIEGLNDDIVKLATGQGQKGDFARTFKQAGEGLLKTGLQGAEGNLLKLLHIGGGKTAKPDGSKDNPFHVVAAGSDASDTSGSAGGTSPSLGGAMGKIAPFIQPFIPHFAGGGDILANHAAMIGEKGPELFLPHTAGRIIPNHALGGSDGGTHFHIDARGSNDPAAVHAAVMRAAPHILAAGQQVNHQTRMRSPGGR